MSNDFGRWAVACWYHLKRWTVTVDETNPPETDVELTTSESCVVGSWLSPSFIPRHTIFPTRHQGAASMLYVDEESTYLGVQILVATKKNTCLQAADRDTKFCKITWCSQWNWATFSSWTTHECRGLPSASHALVIAHHEATALGSPYQAGPLYRSDIASLKSYQPSSLSREWVGNLAGRDWMVHLLPPRLRLSVLPSDRKRGQGNKTDMGLTRTRQARLCNGPEFGSTLEPRARKGIACRECQTLESIRRQMFILIKSKTLRERQVKI
ncbi:hypothetical protein BGW80DRAFT_1252230 [Lactifluus volemus]|nr:hypothetical protein BGW80DRAFT_1252230 [Lactifluus volemus]